MATAPSRGNRIVREDGLLTHGQRALFGAFVFMLATLSAFAVPIYADDLEKDVGLSATKVGLLTTAFAAVYAATQIPAGALAGRLGLNRAFGLSLAALAASLLASAHVSSFLALLVLRATTGLAAGTLFPMASTLVRAADKRANSHAQALLGTGWGVGYLLSAAALPLLFSSWRSPLQLLAALAAAGAILAATTLPAGPVGRVTGIVRAAKGALANSGAWLLGLYLSGLTFANVGIAAWAVPFATHEFGLSLRDAGLLAALIAGGILPAPLAGAAVQRRAGTLAVLALSATGMAVAVALLSAPMPITVVGLALVVTGWCAAFPFGVILALIDTVADPRPARSYGMLVGAVNGIGFLSGMASPPLIGLLHDHGASFQASFLVLLAGPLLAFAAAAGITRRLRCRPITSTQT